jgi:hypothetical protein
MKIHIIIIIFDALEFNFNNKNKNGGKYLGVQQNVKCLIESL